MPVPARASRIRYTSDSLSSTTSMFFALVSVFSRRDCPSEGASLSGHGVDPDAATIPVHDSPANGQSNAGTRILVGRVQAFKKPKNILLVLRVDPDAVVADRECPESVLPLRRDMHGRRAIRRAVLDGIPDDVLEKLLQVQSMDRNRRQWVIRDGRACFGDSTSEVGESGLEGFVRVSQFVCMLKGGCSCIAQQVAHQHLPPGR